MKYIATWPKQGPMRPKRTARFATYDGIVNWADPSFQWAIGKRFETVDEWCVDKGIKIKLVSAEIMRT